MSDSVSQAIVGSNADDLEFGKVNEESGLWNQFNAKRESTISNDGLVLACDNINCSIKTSNKAFACFGKDTKKILHNASLLVKPGRLCAIMGPSGSGKSTLLDVIVNRNLNAKETTGRVSVNGLPIKELFIKDGAFIAQDDVLYPNFTVRETLRFAALLKLPKQLTYKKKMQIVDDTIELLGLKHVSSSRIGGGLFRGISGGERRRVSVGLELLTNPKLLLADEVTSGLDSFAASSIIEVMQKLAKNGNTILCTIHQPSSKIFELFDDLILLSQGHVLYCGDAANAVSYFAKLGYKCPASWNPADYYLELASGSESVALAEAFCQSEEKANIDSALQQLRVNATSHVPSSSACSMFKWQYAAPWWKQLYVLAERNVMALIQNPVAFLQSAVSYILIALIMGALFSNLVSNVYEQFTLMIAFMIDVFGMNAFFAVGTYIQDAEIFMREYRAGYYSTSTYYFSKLFVALPINILISTAYSAILYFWLDIADGDYELFLPFALINYLTMETYLAMNEAIGMLTQQLELAIVVAGFVNTVQMCFSGVFVNYPNMPSYLRWIYWSGAMTYSVSGQMLIQFNDTKAGQQWLKLFGIQMTNYWDCIYILIAFAAGMRVLAFLALNFIVRKK